MDILTYYPKDIFWTKKGEMSSRTQDVSNTEKAVVDCFLLKKFFCDSPPAGCENMNTDDKYLISMYSRKLCGEQRIEVELSITELSREN